MSALLDRYEAWKKTGGCEEGCELLGEMSNEVIRLGALASAAIDFTDTWSDTWLLSGDGMGIAWRINRSEVEPLAGLLAACGHVDQAVFLLEQWIEGEIADREINPGQIIVVDGELVDVDLDALVDAAEGAP